MKNIFQSIKNQDKFGYFISLTFNNEGSSHKTVIGGIVSLFITFMYSAYILYFMYIMYSNSQTQFQFFQNLYDFSSMDPIKFSDTKIFFYLAIQDQNGQLLDFDSVKHLIRIYSYTYTFDVLKNKFGKHNIKDARTCLKSDWQVSDIIAKQYEELFENQEFKIPQKTVCFDQSIGDSDQWRDFRYFNSSELNFQIDYVGCTDKNNPDCLKQMDDIKDLNIFLATFHESMDFNQFTKGKKPVYLNSKPMKMIQFRDDEYIDFIAFMRENYINTYDQWFNIFTPTISNNKFYDFDGIQENAMNRRNLNQNTLFHFLLRISPNQGNYQRNVFNILQFLGTIGGVMDVFITLFSFFICPITEFSFFVSVINKLYFVKINDKKYQSLLTKCFDEKTFPLFHKALEKFERSQQLQNLIFNTQKNYKFIISNLQKVKLFFFKILKCHKLKKRGNTQQLYKIYKKGEKMYKKQVNIERFLHNIQNTKAYFVLLNQQLNHAIKNKAKDTKILEYSDEVSKFIFHHYQKKILEMEESQDQDQLNLSQWHFQENQISQFQSQEENFSSINTLQLQTLTHKSIYKQRNYDQIQMNIYKSGSQKYKPKIFK